jgi:hypothetical protein
VIRAVSIPPGFVAFGWSRPKSSGRGADRYLSVGHLAEWEQVEDGRAPVLACCGATRRGETTRVDGRRNVQQQMLVGNRRVCVKCFVASASADAFTGLAPHLLEGLERRMLDRRARYAPTCECGWAPGVRESKRAAEAAHAEHVQAVLFEGYFTLADLRKDSQWKGLTAKELAWRTGHYTDDIRFQLRHVPSGEPTTLRGARQHRNGDFVVMRNASPLLVEDATEGSTA